MINDLTIKISLFHPLNLDYINLHIFFHQPIHKFLFPTSLFANLYNEVHPNIYHHYYITLYIIPCYFLIFIYGYDIHLIIHF
jgi:hypothetical protein